MKAKKSKECFYVLLRRGVQDKNKIKLHVWHSYQISINSTIPLEKTSYNRCEFTYVQKKVLKNLYQLPVIYFG